MYSVEEVQELYKNDVSLEFLFFSGHQKSYKAAATKSCLSQWYQCTFEMNNIRYTCAEQYMMAEKARLFGDEEALKDILKACHPNQMKLIGKKVRNFDQNIWDKKKISIVKIGNLAKFSQNPKIKKFLIGTHSKILVKTNEYDPIWGIGLSKEDENINNPMKWKGQNLLGFILMDIREIFS